MNDVKTWWQSRTIWVNVIAILFATASMFGMTPSGIDQNGVVDAIMAGVALVNMALRLTTHQPISRTR